MKLILSIHTLLVDNYLPDFLIRHNINTFCPLNSLSISATYKPTYDTLPYLVPLNQLDERVPAKYKHDGVLQKFPYTPHQRTAITVIFVPTAFASKYYPRNIRKLSDIFWIPLDFSYKLTTGFERRYFIENCNLNYKK